MFNLNNPSESMEKARKIMVDVIPEAIENARQSMRQIQKREMSIAQELEKKLFEPSEFARQIGKTKKQQEN